MDVGRFAYARPCQFFRDGGPPITIKWYRAAPGALDFPAAHKFDQLSWYNSPWSATGVGEIYGPSLKWQNGFTPPTASGVQYFGALEDFQQGAVYDPTNDTHRDPWGIADACGGGDPEVILLEPAYKPLMLTEDGGFFLLE